MEHPHLVTQDNRNAAAFPFADLGAELLKQGQHITPGNTAADRPDEDQLKGALVLAVMQ